MPEKSITSNNFRANWYLFKKTGVSFLHLFPILTLDWMKTASKILTSIDDIFGKTFLAVSPGRKQQYWCNKLCLHYILLFTQGRLLWSWNLFLTGIFWDIWRKAKEKQMTITTYEVQKCRQKYQHDSFTNSPLISLGGWNSSQLIRSLVHKY